MKAAQENRMLIRQHVATWTLISPSLILFGLFFLAYTPTFLFASGAIALIWIAFTMMNWRCPRCRTLLPVTGDDSICDHCGYNYKTESFSKGEIEA